VGWETKGKCRIESGGVTAMTGISTDKKIDWLNTLNVA
jgi:hypothetical protein